MQALVAIYYLACIPYFLKRKRIVYSRFLLGFNNKGRKDLENLKKQPAKKLTQTYTLCFMIYSMVRKNNAFLLYILFFQQRLLVRTSISQTTP
jgi:hypothetical protein